MTQTAVCSEHRIEKIKYAYLEEPRQARPEVVKVRVTFTCGAQNIVMMSKKNLADV